MFKQPTIKREVSTAASPDEEVEEAEASDNADNSRARNVEGAAEEASAVDQGVQPGLIEGFVGRDTRERTRGSILSAGVRNPGEQLSKDKQKLVNKLSKIETRADDADEYDDHRELAASDALRDARFVPVLDFNKRLDEQQAASVGSDAEVPSSSDEEVEEAIPTVTSKPVRPSPGVVQNAFDRMRPQRTPTQVTTITIGDKTTTTVLGPTVSKRQKVIPSPRVTESSTAAASQRFSSSMRSFAAPGTQMESAGKSHHSTMESEESDVSGNADDSRSVTPLSKANTMDGRTSRQHQNSSPGDNETESETEQVSDAEQSDEDYLDDGDKKAREDARVAALIQQAEEAAAIPSQDNVKRANILLKGGGLKDSTIQLTQLVEHSVKRIDEALKTLRRNIHETLHNEATFEAPLGTDTDSPEERLSLKVSKEDFSRMNIVGQFNLGFILAVRPSHSSSTSDELFIIDQHASDEKYNFERLQTTTIVQNQRLVHPHPLDLTAIEEEVILENNSALVRNGFIVDMDTTGDIPVGQRCKLVSLPMSREVTFDTTDLEELIALLAETGLSASAPLNSVPRPIKVRKMFAMRACRSSVMIGKSLSMKQMERLVKKMGEIDKPWNCPHGRPTMRHVLGLGAWDGWEEGNGVVGLGEDGGSEKEVDWKNWMGKANVESAEDVDSSTEDQSGLEIMEEDNNSEDEEQASEESEEEEDNDEQEAGDASDEDVGDDEEHEAIGPSRLNPSAWSFR